MQPVTVLPYIMLPLTVEKRGVLLVIDLLEKGGSQKSPKKGSHTYHAKHELRGAAPSG
jgi:predicted RNA binding protein YcfA (HicA-like mRNA interferase family)